MCVYILARVFVCMCVREKLCVCVSEGEIVCVRACVCKGRKK